MVEWDGEEYDSCEESLDEFLCISNMEQGVLTYSARIEDRMAFRRALVTVIGKTPGTRQEAANRTLPPGTYIAIVEYAFSNDTVSYQGTYRLEKRCESHESVIAAPSSPWNKVVGGLTPVEGVRS